MKLNLLPTYVSKGAQAKTAKVVMVLLIIVAILASLGMIFVSTRSLGDAKRRAEDLKPQADEAVAIAKEADTIVASAAGIMRNLELVNAMDKHNQRFPEFYRSILPYIPSFFRATSLTVTPIDEKSCTLNITGVLRTSQQYADLMLAMLRIPGAKSVSRSGFVVVDKIVPNLTEADQKGEPLRPDQGRLPTDPIQRLDALIARASAGTTGFTGVGNFGTEGNLPRQAMPDWSVVTIGVQLETDPSVPPGEAINFDLRTPNPRTTLSASATAAATTAAPGPPIPGAPGPGGPGGPGAGRMGPGGRGRD